MCQVFSSQVRAATQNQLEFSANLKLHCQEDLVLLTQDQYPSIWEKPSGPLLSLHASDQNVTSFEFSFEFNEFAFSLEYMISLN